MNAILHGVEKIIKCWVIDFDVQTVLVCRPIRSVMESKIVRMVLMNNYVIGCMQQIRQIHLVIIQDSNVWMGVALNRLRVTHERNVHIMNICFGVLYQIFIEQVRSLGRTILTFVWVQ
jgi:hypothetical protein